jgi:hypothetical protein
VKKPDRKIVEKISKSYSDHAKKNNNRRHDVKGMVEIGDDGYLEVCLMSASGTEQILHLHRTMDETSKVIAWDCGVFEGNFTRSMTMKEEGERIFENAHDGKPPKVIKGRSFE